MARAGPTDRVQIVPVNGAVITRSMLTTALPMRPCPTLPNRISFAPEPGPMLPRLPKQQTLRSVSQTSPPTHSGLNCCGYVGISDRVGQRVENRGGG